MSLKHNGDYGIWWEIGFVLAIFIFMGGLAYLLVMFIGNGLLESIESKQSCESTLPRNIEFVWSKPEGFEE